VAVALLAQKIAPVPKEVLEQMRRMLLPEDGSRPLWATLLLVSLTPAICEEALFRGPVLRGLATKLPPLSAAVLTGVLFGVFHLDIYRLLPTAILGVLLSYAALASGSIIPAMVAHLCNNAMLLTLATLKLDDRLSTLGTFATVGLIAGSVLLTVAGVLLIRRGGAQARL
jgi:sodium transport system permease protein